MLEDSDDTQTCGARLRDEIVILEEQILYLSWFAKV